MSEREPAPALVTVAPTIREHLPALIDAVVARIQASIPV
jgi:hypothetical protein